MKKHLCTAALAAPLLAIAFQSSALAQGVRVIDLKYIFENNSRFKYMTEEMKRSVAAAEQDINARKEQVNRLREELKKYKKESVDYTRREQELTRLQVELTAQVQNQRRDFLRREARIYYIVYQEIVQEVRSYSEQNRIALVLRFNGEPMTDQDPDKVTKYLNKPVVYIHRQMDITPIINDALNKRFVPPQPGGNATRPIGVPRR